MTAAFDGVEPVRACIGSGGRRRTFKRRTRLHRAGEKLLHVLLIEDGWVARFRTDENGKSAMMAFHMPGDIVGADALAGPIEDELVALTDVSLLEMPTAALLARAAEDASLALSLAGLLALETTLLREALFAVGSQSSDARLCTFFLQTLHRQVAAGLVDPAADAFELPLTQTELAAATGLTSVHVNRVLRVLRERNWLDFQAGFVRLLDREALRRSALLVL